MPTDLRASSFLAACLVLLGSCSSSPAGEELRRGSEGTARESVGIALAGETAALSYSGFRVGQHPDRGEGERNPSRSEILEDLTILSLQGVRLIRLYDSGTNSQDVLRLIDEEAIPIKVLLGSWLRAEVSNHHGCPWLDEPIPTAVLVENKRQNALELKRTIRLAVQYPEVVCAINVGNEALVEWNDHMVPADSVLDYVRTVRSSVKQPVTVADNWAWWTTDAGIELAAELDFVGVHSYPVWEGKGVEVGLASTVSDIESVQAAIPNVPVAILEAGWASTSAEFGERASEAAQERYVAELLGWANETGTTVFLFEAFDEPWKGDPRNPAGAEKHWGLWNVDRTPKAAVAALADRR